MWGPVARYAKFFSKNRSAYLSFNKQLGIGELAGFGSGIAMAEVAAAFTRDEATISGLSSAADYIASILGFLAVFYYDMRRKYEYRGEKKARTKKILKSAFSLWPSVVAGDIAFILARPYFHYTFLTMGLEAGIAATVAHFLAFGLFNAVAIFSKSLIDFSKSESRKVDA